MRGLYRGYLGLTAAEYDELWKDATFVFDANVLLNLYRYQSSTASSLLSVLREMSHRIWMPYQVGLEFERNRLSVVVDQHNRFSDVRAIVEKAIHTIQSELEALQLKTRHSHINPDKLLQGFTALKGEYFSELEELEKDSLQPASEDLIRNELYKLFEGKVGAPPTQADLDQIFSDGERRYTHQFPPGFKDAQKDGKEDSFTYGGLVYKKKFGDLIVWQQIIAHAKANNLKDLIYVTDDGKSDWWFIIKGKTVGPRPELIDEISREAGVDRFHIYTSEAFLKYANEHLDANVGTAAIDDVREVLASTPTRNFFAESLSARANEFLEFSDKAEAAVFEWLADRFGDVRRNSQYPDFIAYRDRLRYGFDVKVLSRTSSSTMRLEMDLQRALQQARLGEFYQLTVVYVLLDTDFIGPKTDLLRAKAQEFRRRESFGALTRLKILVGYLDDVDQGAGEFIRFTEFDVGD